jgi:hypothetical protein
VGHLSVKMEVTTAKGVMSSYDKIVCSSCGGSGRT